MAKSAKRQFGDLGEDVACLYLKKREFRILERNYLRKWGEIDIVAENGSVISFVEVKTVSREPVTVDGSRATFRPEDNVHPQKVKRLHRAIQTYLLDRKIPVEKPWRLDVACVYLDIQSRKAKVEMLENIVP